MPKRAKKKGQKPVLESMSPEITDDQGVQPAAAAAPPLPVYGNAGGADLWWEKDMARSLRSWDFFSEKSKGRAKSRLPRA